MALSDEVEQKKRKFFTSWLLAGVFFQKRDFEFFIFRAEVK